MNVRDFNTAPRGFYALEVIPGVNLMVRGDTKIGDAMPLLYRLRRIVARTRRTRRTRTA